MNVKKTFLIYIHYDVITSCPSLQLQGDTYIEIITYVLFTNL